MNMRMIARHVHIYLPVRYYAQWRLSECRCGRRRTILAGNHGGGYSPLMPGWPRPSEDARVAYAGGVTR